MLFLPTFFLSCAFIHLRNCRESESVPMRNFLMKLHWRWHPGSTFLKRDTSTYMDPVLFLSLSLSPSFSLSLSLSLLLAFFLTPLNKKGCDCFSGATGEINSHVSDLRFSRSCSSLPGLLCLRPPLVQFCETPNVSVSPSQLGGPTARLLWYAVMV